MEREGIVTKVKTKMDEVTPPGVDLPFDDIVGPILDECAKDIAAVVPLHLLSPITMVCRTTKRYINTNIATLTLSTIHPFKVGNVVTISGITGETSYNGDFSVTAITTTSISYALIHADELETVELGGIVTFKTIVTGNKAYIPKPDDFLRLYEMKFPLWQKTVRETTKPDTIGGKIQENPYLTSGIGRPTVMAITTMPTGWALREYLVCAKVETAAIPIALYIRVQLPEELPDKLIDSLTWLTASKVLKVSGMNDQAQVLMEQYGLSLTQLAQA